MGRKENENTLSVIFQYLTPRGNRTGFYYNETVDLNNDVIFAETCISCSFSKQYCTTQTGHG